MKPIISLAKNADNTYNTVTVLSLEDTDKLKSSSAFSTHIAAPDIVAIETTTGLLRTLPAVLYDFDELSSQSKIKVDGRVVTLDKVNKTAFRMALFKVEEAQDFFVEEPLTVKQVNTVEELLKDDGYADFIEMNKDKLGLTSITTSGDIVSKMVSYEGIKHILLLSMAGLGKTYSVGLVSKATGRKTFFKALDNGTESIDLMGHLIKTSTGNFLWKDGVVTQAFRAAAKGEKVILFLDELLRAPDREQSILVGALTPNSDNKFILRTGRALESTESDGIVEEEVLEVDPVNLWCIATTNMGANYHTGTLDKALADRFRIMELLPDRDKDLMLTAQCIEKSTWGAKLSSTQQEAVANTLINIAKEIDVYIETGSLQSVMTVRHLIEVVSASKNKIDLKTRVLDLCSNLTSINTTGSLDVDQLKLLHTLVKSKLK